MRGRSCERLRGRLGDPPDVKKKNKNKKGDWGSDLCTVDMLLGAAVAMDGKGCAALYREETWSLPAAHLFLLSSSHIPTTHMALLGLGLHASPGCGAAVSWRYHVIMLLTLGIWRTRFSKLRNYILGCPEFSISHTYPSAIDLQL
jgi:hypothetical protein